MYFDVTFFLDQTTNTSMHALPYVFTPSIVFMCLPKNRACNLAHCLLKDESISNKANRKEVLVFKAFFMTIKGSILPTYPLYLGPSTS